jgi:hypothetical protein
VPAGTFDSLGRGGEVLRQRCAELEDGPSAHGAEAHAREDGAFVTGRERGCVAGERVVGVGLEQAAPGQQAQHARVHVAQERLDVLLRGRGSAGEGELACIISVKPAVEADQMVMGAQVEAAAPALHECDRAAFCAIVTAFACEATQAPLQRFVSARCTAVQSGWS